MTCTGWPAPGSVVLLAAGRGTLVDALLATAVLLEVSLDAALGWWWTGPLTVWRVPGRFWARRSRWSFRPPPSRPGATPAADQAVATYQM